MSKFPLANAFLSSLDYLEINPLLSAYYHSAAERIDYQRNYWLKLPAITIDWSL